MTLGNEIILLGFALLGISIVIFPGSFGEIMKSTYSLSKPPNNIILRAMGMVFVLVVFLIYIEGF